MILSKKCEFMAIATIAALVLLAALPAGVAADTLFEDDFESGNLDKWTVDGMVDVTNDSTYAPSWGGYYARFSGNAACQMQRILSAEIDTTCMKNITFSFALRTVNLTLADNEKFAVQFNDGSGWKPAPAYSDNLSWSQDTLSLPATADDNPNLRIRCSLGNADPGEYAFLDNVTVTGEPMLPAIAVNKTVWNGTAWVKAHTAKINDTLQFTCTITNTGNVNLTQIRFWDILDCSLEFEDWPYSSHSYMFKPKVLHPDSEWDLSSPKCEYFMELCPSLGYSREILEWDDTDGDSNVSACDQVLLSSEPKWYHVDRVPYTLNLSSATYGTKYFDSVLNWDGVDLSDPINSTWLEVCCCKDQYTMIDWIPLNCPVGIEAGDTVIMRNERTLEEVEYTVEEVAIDLVVSREYEVGDLLNPTGLILEPYQTITIEYNATVVRCGVDNNTFVAKGIGCGDNWTYSDPAVVTITVPCPSGDAADGTPVIKDLFACDEPVYALAHDFAPNKSVDIYITPVRTWTFGDNISDYAIVGPVPVVTDPNGSIGINPKVLMWPDPVPGLYHMVFDDPDGIYEPGVDLYDFFEVRCVAVPLITPLGLVALVGLLGVIATSTLVRRRRR